MTGANLVTYSTSSASAIIVDVKSVVATRQTLDANVLFGTKTVADSTLCTQPHSINLTDIFYEMLILHHRIFPVRLEDI